MKDTNIFDGPFYEAMCASETGEPTADSIAAQGRLDGLSDGEVAAQVSHFALIPFRHTASEVLNHLTQKGNGSISELLSDAALTAAHLGESHTNLGAKLLREFHASDSSENKERYCLFIDQAINDRTTAVQFYILVNRLLKISNTDLLDQVVKDLYLSSLSPSHALQVVIERFCSK